MPSSMPAGTSTVIVRRARTRPSAPQVGHGDGICSPVPAQAAQAPGGHHLAEERALHRLDLARPAARWQVRGEVPGAQPVPVQVPQTTAVSTGISRRTSNSCPPTPPPPPPPLFLLYSFTYILFTSTTIRLGGGDDVADVQPRRLAA